MSNNPLKNTALFTTIGSNNSGICRGNVMHTEKLSISLARTLVNFVDQYQTTHACKSRSEVVQEAIKLLQQKELEYHYKEASKEIDPAFDITAADGLDDETW